MKSKLISVVTPCFNEGQNVEELCQRVRDVMGSLPYDYEHILIDNKSTDDTLERLRSLAASDTRIRVIANARNFGHIRSPYHALLQASGDAAVLIAGDLQDPPEILPEFIRAWEQGFKSVMAVKPRSDESWVMYRVRSIYYRLLSRISEVPLVQNATGAGLYDREVLEILRSMNDPYPYFRGLIAEIGFPIATVPFTQPRRKRGVSSNNFYTLYDIAMLGVTNHSKVPLRVLTMLGFLTAGLSALLGIVYLLAKLVFWESFSVGVAPALIGIFFLGSVQMIMIGVLGEYVGAIYTHVRQLPHVIEAERINFLPKPPSESSGDPHA